MPEANPLVCALIDEALYHYFYMDLARVLKEQHGATLHLYAKSGKAIKNTQKEYGHLFQSFNLIESGNSASPAPVDDDRVIQRASYYERKFGIPFMRFLVTDRGYGLGFALGGFYHPRLKANDSAALIDVLAQYVKTLDFWERELTQKKISLVLNGFFFEYFSAKALDIPVRRIYGSRYKNFHLWTDDCFGNCKTLKQAFSKTKPSAESEKPVEAPSINREYLHDINKRSSIGNLIYRTYEIILRELYRRYIGGRKKYDLPSELNHVYRMWRDLRRLSRDNSLRISDLKDVKYVYYALQVEPEMNLQVYSQEYFFQLGLIASIARDLPAGCILVVKEHLPAVGRRPDLFYDQIRLLKNVKMADVRESGLELVRGARAVVTISGTVGQEAATMGKPVLSFGRHNLYNIIPHVRCIRQEEEIYPAIRWALSDEFDSDKAIGDGNRFLEAIRMQSFDLGKFGLMNQRGHSEESLCDAAELLLKTLEHEQPESIQAEVLG